MPSPHHLVEALVRQTDPRRTNAIIPRPRGMASWGIAVAMPVFGQPYERHRRPGISLPDSEGRQRMQLTERRRCAEPRCDRLFIPKSSRHRYCLEHRRTKPRDPMHDVRYGPAHRRLRAQVASRVRADLAGCARCGEPMDPREPWDLGHAAAGGPRSYSGPEHARCNRATNDGRWLSRSW